MLTFFFFFEMFWCFSCTMLFKEGSAAVVEVNLVFSFYFLFFPASFSVISARFSFSVVVRFSFE